MPANKKNNGNPRLLLSATRLRKGYGDQTVLDIDRLSIYEDERIGLSPKTARANPRCWPFWPESWRRTPARSSAAARWR